MKSTDAFQAEHALLSPQLEQVGRSAPAYESVAEARGQAVLVAAALVDHAQLEDELLFSALERRIGADEGPLAVMRREHDEIEAALDALARADDLAEARDTASRLVEVAREHFAKEEQVLFPLAAEVLGENELDRQGDEWQRRRLGS